MKVLVDGGHFSRKENIRYLAFALVGLSFMPIILAPLVSREWFSFDEMTSDAWVDFLTDLSVYRNGEEVARKTIRVNDPLEGDGFRFHQSTFGPIASLEIRDASWAMVGPGPVVL